MSFMDDLKRWAKGEDEEDEEEDELEAAVPQTGAGRSRAVKTEDGGSSVNIPITDFRRSSNNKVVNINATTWSRPTRTWPGGWWISSAASPMPRTGRSKR